MTDVRVLLAALALLLAAPASLAQDSWDGLQRVPSKQFDEMWLMAGADFGAYRKVLLDPIEVSFRKNWERDVNRSGPPSARPRVTAAEAERIRRWMAEDFEAELRKELTAAGYVIAGEPGPDVLRLTPVLMNVQVNAPDATGRSYRMDVYMFEAGEATLALETRDSELGTLLARVVDRRRTDEYRWLQFGTEATNRAEFREVFERWSRTMVEGLLALRMMPAMKADAPRE
jgi:hypothetical protein